MVGSVLISSSMRLRTLSVPLFQSLSETGMTSMSSCLAIAICQCEADARTAWEMVTDVPQVPLQISIWAWETLQSLCINRINTLQANCLLNAIEGGLMFYVGPWAMFGCLCRLADNNKHCKEISNHICYALTWGTSWVTGSTLWGTTWGTPWSTPWGAL